MIVSHRTSDEQTPSTSGCLTQPSSRKRAPVQSSYIKRRRLSSSSSNSSGCSFTFSQLDLFKILNFLYYNFVFSFTVTTFTLCDPVINELFLDDVPRSSTSGVNQIDSDDDEFIKNAEYVFDEESQPSYFSNKGN